MSDSTEPMPETIAEASAIPEWRRFWDQPPEPEALRDWTVGLTPGLIAAALWLPWMDGLGMRALPYGSLSIVLAGVWGGAWASLPLFFAAMSLVKRTGKPIRRILAETFGPEFVLISHGLVAFFVLTLAIDISADWYFKTLARFGILEFPVPAAIRYLTTSVWALWVIPIGYGMVRIMAALIDHVLILIVGVLAAVLVNTLFFLGEPQLTMPEVATLDQSYAFRQAFQWTFGFAALCALFAAEWGIGLKSRKDRVFGGLIGIGFGVPIVATVGLVAISIGAATGSGVTMYDLVASLGTWPSLVCGLLVGTYLLAPGVFASYHLLQDLRQVRPGVHHYFWLVLTIAAVQAVISANVPYSLMTLSAWIAIGLLAVLTVLSLQKDRSAQSAATGETPSE